MQFLLLAIRMDTAVNPILNDRCAPADGASASLKGFGKIPEGGI